MVWYLGRLVRHEVKKKTTNVLSCKKENIKVKQNTGFRTAFYDECTEALERLLNYRLANQPIKHIVMTEYVPRIREMCEHKSRRSRRKRHWMLDDEQVQTLVRERKFHDEVGCF